MNNPLEIIKRQINEQTRQPINTDVNKANILGVTKQKDAPNIGSVTQINPIWTRGSYRLSRNSVIDVKNFLGYFNKTKWELVDSRVTFVKNAPAQSNNLFGCQFFATENISLTFNLSVKNGYLGVYKKTDDLTEFVQIAAYTGTESPKSISIPLQGGVHTTIIFTFYCTDASSELLFSSDYSNVMSWRYLDITSPKVPNWATPSLSVVTVEPTSARSKIVLKWYKDEDIGFGGNGIYKKTTVNSGLTASTKPPATLYKNLGGTINDRKYVVNYFGTGTLNSGDLISFTTPTFRVNDIKIISYNKARNPFFKNSSTHWTTSGAGFAITNGIQSEYGANHYLLETTISATRRTVTSTLFRVSLGSLYYAGVLSDADLMKKRAWGQNGWNITPSGWTISGGIVSILATRAVDTPRLRVVRNTTANGIFRTSNTSFYLNANASLYISCTASFHSLESYKVRFYTDANVLVYTSPSLWARSGFTSNVIKFTPSSSSNGYMTVTVPPKRTGANFATMLFNSFQLEQNNRTSNYKELFQVLYFKSDKTPCTKPRSYIEMSASPNTGLQGFIFGTTTTATLPSNCYYCKLRYAATLNGGTTRYAIRRLHYFTASVLGNYNPLLNTFATTTTWVTTTKPMTYSVGNTIFYDKYEHVTDRPRQSDDGHIISWDDYDVANLTTYEYYLDAYDTSAFKNRSDFSAVATINSGDKIPPGVVVFYTLTPAKGGLIHAWQAPVDTDFSHVTVHSASSLSSASRIFTKNSPLGAKVSYFEANTSTIPVNRYLACVDTFGNVGAYVLRTATPLPSDESSVSMDFYYENAGGTKINPSAKGWFKDTTVNVVYTGYGDSPIASYFYSYHIPDVSPVIDDWSTWTNLGSDTLSLTDSARGAEYKYYLRLRVKDIYGNYSNSKLANVWFDTTYPTLINKDTFWTQTENKSSENYNKLIWDNSKVTDKYKVGTGYNTGDERSGHFKTNIRRSSVTILNKNPLFEEGTPNTLPMDWTLGGVSGVASLITTDAYYNKNCAKLRLTSTVAGSGPRLKSNNFSLSNSENITVFLREKPTIVSGTGTYVLAIKRKRDDFIYGSSSISGITTSTDWKYRALNFAMPGGSFSTLAYIDIHFTNGQSGSHLKLDSIVAVKNLAVATIDTVSSSINTYVDTKVEAWKTYVYSLTLEDEVGNISPKTPYQLYYPVPNFKTKYRNMLNNSSFEKTVLKTNGSLQAENWVRHVYVSAFATTKPTSYENHIVRRGEHPFHGKNYLQLRYPSLGNGDILYQHNINILPYTGTTRKFILSAYLKRTGRAGYSNGGYYKIFAYDSNKNLVSSKENAWTATSLTAYNRVQATFSVTNPLITNFSIGIGASNISEVYCDSVQFEETTGDTPTDYYDGYAVTADYLQGALIRGNMIEANTIVAGHIQANTITATQIKASTITTDELRFTNPNIYIKTPQTPVSTGSFTVFPATLGNYSPIMATLDLSAITGYKDIGIISPFTTRTGASNLFYMGHWTPDMTLINYYNYPGFAGYYRYPKFMASKYYVGSEAAYMMLDNGVENYWTYSSTRSTDKIFRFEANWSVPAAWGLATYVPNENLISCWNEFQNYGMIAYINGTNLAIYRCISGSAPLFLFNHTIDASVLSSNISIAPHPTKNENIICWVDTGTGLNNTIHIDIVNISGTVLRNFDIMTYGGLVSSSSPWGEKSSLTVCEVTYLKNDLFFITYKFAHSNLLYYKIFDAVSETILVGTDRDLILAKYDIGCMPGYYINKPILRTNYSDDILLLLPSYAGPALYSASLTKYTNIFPRPRGNSMYIQNSETNVELSDLFNRLT